MENSTNFVSAVSFKSCPVCGEPLHMSANGSVKSCSKCLYNEKLVIGSPVDTAQLLSDSKSQVTTTDSQNPSVSVGGMYGWICPKCGAVMSPFTSCCPNCTPPRNFEITCSAVSDQRQAESPANFDIYKFIGGRKDRLGYE